MQELRQSTAINVKIGPVVSTTGLNPVTNLTISGADEAEILKNNTTATLAISGTLGAITSCDGWYNLSLTTGDTDELGPLTLVIQDDSACLPVFRDYMIVDQGYYDTKYNSTGSFRASISAAAVAASLTTITYSSLGAFHASVAAYSTFDPATAGVSLGAATYNTATSFHASVTGYSTFDSSTDGVSLGAATYNTATSFHASVTGYSTFDSSTDGVSLTAAVVPASLTTIVYSSLGAFHASVAAYSTFDPAASGVSLGAATYNTATSFHASVTGYSTFDPATDGVSLGAATYNTATSFHASVTGYSTFDPASDAVSLGAASFTQINAEVVDALNVDTYAEPGQEAPGATVPITTKIGYLYKFARNKIDNDGTTVQVYNDAGAVVDQKSTVGEAGGTVTRGEFGTGP